MKAQKLGLVLGINMVAACLMMQGCAHPDSDKAKREGRYAPRSATDNRVTVISRPAPASRQLPPPAQSQALPAQPVQQQEMPVQPIQQQGMLAPSVQQEPVIVETTTPAPAPVVQDMTPPAPSSVRTVKKLPAVPPKTLKTKPASAPAKVAASSDEVASAEYIVQPGDSLSKISKKTNYKEDAILAANPGIKDRNRLRIGQKIKLPGAIATSAVAKASVPVTKDVATKDVAAKDDAAKDKVKLAAASASAAANTAAPVKTKGGFVPYEGPTKDYVVKSGDSMGQIAVSYGISIRALKALNGLKGDALRAGQKLKVPAEKQTAAKAVPAKPAVAAKGDDAKAATAPAVKEAAAPVPAAEAAKPAEPVKAEEPAKKPEENTKVEGKGTTPAVEVPAAPSQHTHTVKEGEDLVSIAIAYGISPSALMDLNDLKPTDEVKPDQVLKLPANAK